MNLYTYCSNNPIRYYDPTGHWQVSDAKLTKEAQLEIDKLTKQYFLADDDKKIEIHKKAQAIRDNKKNLSKEKVSITSGIIANKFLAKTTQKDSNGIAYMTAADWNRVQIETNKLNSKKKVVESMETGNKGDGNHNEVLFSKIDELTAFANSYTNDKQLVNQLVLQFIRREKYDSGTWDIVAGEIDEGFVNFVAESNSGLTDYFSGDLYINDPTGVKVDFVHFTATLNAYLYDSTDLKANLVGEKNINNLAGWAGDLQTFVIDVQNETNNSNSYAKVYESASRLIGDSSTSFSMGDLLADTDAYNIYNQLGTSTFGDALRNYYSSGYQTRYTDFTNGMNKWMISRTVNRYTEDYFLYPVQKWPLLGETNVTQTQSRAVGDAFTDFIWNKVLDER